MEAPSTGVAAGATATITLAGVGTTAILEALPKGVIVSICVILCGIVTYLAKRDYNRFRDLIATNNQRLQSMEAWQRGAVTHTEHRESMGGVHRKLDELFSVLRNDLGDMHTRVTILETKQGLHDAPRAKAEAEKA